MTVCIGRQENVRRVGDKPSVLTRQNIEAELSYAYLHSVAAHAGFSCEIGNRHRDGAGVDATVVEDGRKLAVDSKLMYVLLDVQLKATYQNLAESEGRFSYSLEMAHYDKLRNTEIAAPRILVVLRLPENPDEWLQVTDECLIAKRCAHWVSLYGAPAVTSQESKTVHIPLKNVVSPDGLRAIMTMCSRQETIPYGDE